MVTERGLPSEDKSQLLHKTTLATSPTAKLPSLAWFVTWHTSSYKEGGPHRERAPCRILASRNALLVELSPPHSPSPLYSSFLLPFIPKGQKPAFFSFILLVFHTYKQLLWQDNVYQSLL